MISKLSAFKALGISDSTLEALAAKGFEEPTKIQEKVIPILLNNDDIDVVGKAQTGTGKTAAFGIPLVEKIDDSRKDIQALILAPTRELAVQVAEEISSIKGKKRLQVVPIYGGQNYDLQFKRLKAGAQIVVGTPGRILDHINRGTINLSTINFFVLDEADEMLDMGFIPDIEEILKSANSQRRMLLFSATMPARILALAKKFMRKGFEVIEAQKEQMNASLTDQIYFEVRESDKFEALCRIIDVEKEFYGMVFCRTKTNADTVAHKLIERGYDADQIHGDISQNLREKVLMRFRTKKVTILVCTDVAARGIDVSDLTHVINFSLPQDPESYVHRIGRTGRAGKEGTAITFVTPEEYRKLLFIQKVSKASIRKEKLPGIKDVINSKKERLQSDIDKVVEEGIASTYQSFGQELLSKYNPEQLVNAFLKMMYQEELDEKSYNEIVDRGSRNRDVRNSEPQGSDTRIVDAQGKTRLFIALGEKDEMNAQAMVDFIVEKTGVKSEKIKEVKIFELFSFVTVSFEDAEFIVDIFKRDKTGRRSLVEIAKEKSRDGGSDRPSRDRGNFRSGNSERPSRPSAGGDRPRRSFGDRPDRGPRGDGADRSSSRPSGDRSERPSRPSGERSERPSRPRSSGGEFKSRKY